MDTLNALKVITSEHLTETVDVRLTRFQLFLYHLYLHCQRAEIIYPFFLPRLYKTEVRPSRRVLVMGDTLICHPDMLAVIRARLASDERGTLPAISPRGASSSPAYASYGDTGH